MTLADKKKLIQEIYKFVEYNTFYGVNLDLILDETKSDEVDPFPTLRAWAAEIEAEQNP